MNFKSTLTIPPSARLLGSGGFGKVYLGNHGLHGDVAVKILHQGANESVADFNARTAALLTEGGKLKSAEHLNVVRVFDVLEHGPSGQFCLILQACDGGSLESAYKAGPLSVGAMREILNGTISGLAHVHSKGIIHRDIKPGNILIHQGVPKISDFGISRDADVFGYASYFGYTDHLAPEAHIEKVTSVKTDVWALGMTVYRLLHGHTFYEEVKREATIAHRIASGSFAGSLKWLPHIPDEWRRFIRAMLHEDKTQRLQDMHAVHQKLSSIPATPDWACTHSAAGTIWIRTKPDGRILRVERTIKSTQKQSWSATLSGAGKRTMTYGDATDFVAPSAAEKALVNFFEGTGST